MPIVRRLVPPLAVAALVVLPGCVIEIGGRDVEIADATPQRPTLSNDAHTTAAGTAELEAGVRVDPGDAFDSPVLLKVGLSERTELAAGLSPYQWVAARGPDPDGTGDLEVHMRHRIIDETDQRPATAIQIGAKLPTGADALSSGEIDVSFGGSATKTAGPVEMTGYYLLEVLGQPQPGDTDLRHVLAAAATGPLRGRLSGFGELAVVLEPEADSEQVLATLGAALRTRRDQVIDAGIVVGLSDDAPAFQLVVGFTQNFGGPPR